MERAEIANRAQELFTRISFVKTSVADIAAACGLGKGSIYLQFQSKDEILLEVIDSRAKRFMAENGAFFRDGTVPLERKIERYFDNLVDEYFSIKDLLFGDFDSVKSAVLQDVVRKCDVVYQEGVDCLFAIVKGDAPESGKGDAELRDEIAEFMELIVGRMLVFQIWHDWRDKEGLKEIVKPLAVKLFATLRGKQ
ncbi:MAG TPA: TetR/AcrR family transcriptional regulator [Treponemataceae bacterium]|nr:TetR/AcrR family transcriptional regulator [Treponemataceae bacterium]